MPLGGRYDYDLSIDVHRGKERNWPVLFPIKIREHKVKTETNLGNRSVIKLQKKDGDRVYSKKHYCLYTVMQCHEIARHFL